MNFYIYKSVRKSTGEYYIGKRCFKGDIETDRYMGSGTVFVSKYNKDTSDWDKEILKVCENREHLADMENQLIGDLWNTDDKCLNLKPGGEGGAVPGRDGTGNPSTDHTIYTFYLNGEEKFTGTRTEWRKELGLVLNEGLGHSMKEVFLGNRFSSLGWSILEYRPIKTCSNCGHKGQARGFNLHDCK